MNDTVEMKSDHRIKELKDCGVMYTGNEQLENWTYFVPQRMVALAESHGARVEK